MSSPRSSAACSRWTGAGRTSTFTFSKLIRELVWWSPCVQPLPRSPPVVEAGSCSRELNFLSKWLELSLHLGERVAEAHFLFSRRWREDRHHCCWVVFCKWVQKRGRQCWKSVSLTCQPIFKTKMKRSKIKTAFPRIRIHINTKTTIVEQQNQNWPELEDTSFTRSPLK